MFSEVIHVASLKTQAGVYIVKNTRVLTFYLKISQSQVPVSAKLHVAGSHSMSAGPHWQPCVQSGYLDWLARPVTLPFPLQPGNKGQILTFSQQYQVSLTLKKALETLRVQWKMPVNSIIFLF